MFHGIFSNKPEVRFTQTFVHREWESIPEDRRDILAKRIGSIIKQRNHMIVETTKRGAAAAGTFIALGLIPDKVPLLPHVSEITAFTASSVIAGAVGTIAIGIAGPMEDIRIGEQYRQICGPVSPDGYDQELDG